MERVPPQRRKKEARLGSTTDLAVVKSLSLVSVEFYLYPTVSTALVHSVKPKLTE